MISMIVLGIAGAVALVRRRRKNQARDRLRKQIMESTRPSAPLYNHPQFTMMKSSSIPFIPVNLSPATHGTVNQSKIYDLKAPAKAASLYRTPSQSSKYPKFNIVNSQ